MLFRFKPWELTTKKWHSLLQEHRGLMVLMISDVALLQWAKREITSFFGGEEHFEFLSGSELTPSWCEAELFTPSLFALQEKNRFILEAGQTPSETIPLLLSEKTSWSFSLFLHFTTKNGPFWKELQKKERDSIPSLVLETPQHWEWKSYLHFVLERDNYPFRFHRLGEELFLQRVDPSALSIETSLKQLALTFPDHTLITEKEVKELLSQGRWDFFELAELFSSRRFEEFFGRVASNRNMTGEEIRQLSLFMQGHLLKLEDPTPSNVAKKGRYERTILEDSKKWKKEELQRAQKLWGSLETLSKKDPQFAKHELQLLTKGRQRS